VSTRDVIVLPAGGAPKSPASDGRFRAVGAYPDGRSWDL